METTKIKKLVIVIIVLLMILGIEGFLFFKENNAEIKTIKSNKQLLNIYRGENNNNSNNLFFRILTLPFTHIGRYDGGGYYMGATSESSGWQSTWSTNSSDKSLSAQSYDSSDDYSTTNIQVENVDEADITKTDGK